MKTPKPSDERSLYELWDECRHRIWNALGIARVLQELYQNKTDAAGSIDGPMAFSVAYAQDLENVSGLLTKELACAADLIGELEADLYVDRHEEAQP
jgi:hypothetical protein